MGVEVAAVVGDAEIDIRPATEPWDIGLGKKPDGAHDAPLHRDAQGRARTPRPARRRRRRRWKRWRHLIGEMKQAGVLLSTGSLEPSSGAARLRNFGGKQTVVDGPFAESKELVGGFVDLELDSRAEAIEWAQRYADVLGEVELDIRPVAGMSDFGR